MTYETPTGPSGEEIGMSVQQVRVKRKDDDSETPSIGRVPIRSLPRWESNGWVAVDEDEVAAARAAAGLTPDGQAVLTFAEPVLTEVPAAGPPLTADPTVAPADDDGAHHDLDDVATESRADLDESDTTTTPPVGEDGTAAGNADDQTPTSDSNRPGRAGRGR